MRSIRVYRASRWTKASWRRPTTWQWCRLPWVGMTWALGKPCTTSFPRMNGATSLWAGPWTGAGRGFSVLCARPPGGHHWPGTDHRSGHPGRHSGVPPEAGPGSQGTGGGAPAPKHGGIRAAPQKYKRVRGFGCHADLTALWCRKNKYHLIIDMDSIFDPLNPMLDQAPSGDRGVINM